MKKKTVIITVLILTAALLLGLFIRFRYEKKQQEALEAGQNAVIVSHDKTVYPEFIYNIDSISLESIIGEKHYSFDFSEQKEPEAVISRSTDIVHGRISNLSFTFINGKAWTVAELNVLESLKGELQPEDVISVYYPGGYVSTRDYNSFYHKDKSGSDSEFYQSFVDSAPVPYLMEEGVFFLSCDTKPYSLAEGTYILSCGNSSVCSYIDDNTLSWLGTELSPESLLNLIN